MLNIIIIIITLLIISSITILEPFDNYDMRCIYLNATAAERALENKITRDNLLIQQKSEINFIEHPVGKDYMKLNDLKYNYDEDYGIMKPYVKNHKYYGIKAEIHPSQMVTIIRTMMKQYPKTTETYTPIDLNRVNMVTYDVVKNKITANISQIAKVMSVKGISEITDINDIIKYDNKTKFHKVQTTENFVIFYDKLYYSGISKNYSNYKFVTKIYRAGAEIFYTLYHDISYNFKTSSLHINNMNIVSISFEEDIHFGKYKKASLDMKNADGVDCSMVESTECNTKLSTDKDYMKNRNKFLVKRKMEHQLNKDESLYKCYFKNAITKAECESYELIKDTNSFRTSDKKPGLWAKSQCTSNEECPFYKNNQNYNNNRGGCVNGKCELPINMKLLTPTIPDSKSIPLCHNCKNPEGKTGLNCLMCCEDQFDNSKYPTLVTPDYAFEDDFNERLEPAAAKNFEKKGLSAHDLRC
jgi:hypothetical protein